MLLCCEYKEEEEDGELKNFPAAVVERAGAGAKQL